MNYYYLKTEKLTYKVRRSKKVGRITISVNSDGVELILPVGVSLRTGERFVLSKLDWIENKLALMKKDYGKYFLLGKEVFPQLSGGVFTFSEQKPTLKINDELASAEFEKFLFSVAQKYIAERTTQLAFQYGFQFNKVKIKKLKSRWGSCSAKKNLSFNFKLMEYSPNVIDYVIIHELCHTKIMNHSKTFWELVESIIPEYKKLRKQLKRWDKHER